MNKPNPHTGLRHLALYCQKLEETAKFYIDILGLKLVWQPDPDNYYLSSGSDNLALHRAPDDFAVGKNEHLDHLGFFLTTPEDVDTWHEYMVANNVKIMKEPKNHRDGTKSFYCADPDGNVVQMIYYPDVLTV